MVDPLGMVTGPGLSAGRWGFLRSTPHWRAARVVRRQLRARGIRVHLGQLRHAYRESRLLDALQSGDEEAYERAVDRLSRVSLMTGQGETSNPRLLASLGRHAYTRTDFGAGLTILSVDADRAQQNSRGRGAMSHDEVLRRYSPTVRQGLVELGSHLGEDVIRVGRELCGRDRIEILRDWLTSAPPWLPEDPRLCTWLAELALATSSNDAAVAAAWFDRAIALGGSPRAYLKVRRFYTRDDAKDDRFRDELSDVLSEPLVRAVGPTDTSVDRVALLDQWVATSAAQRAFKSLLRTQLLQARGDYDEAIEEGREAYEAEGYLGAGLIAAEALLRRSFTDPRRTHGADIATALTLTTSIRADQTSWGLDSGHALALTVRAQMALADFDAAWALIAPGSDTTDVERDHREVREVQVTLLVELGRLSEARAIIDDSFPRSLRLQVDARAAELALDTDTSTRLWSEVIDETDDLTQKAGLCLRLAMQGQVHPWVGELRRLNPEIADEVELIAALFSGADGAELRARSLVQSSMRVAHALVARYIDLGRSADAAHFAERAAEKWNIADDWLRAAISRLQLGENDKAAVLATRALSAGGDRWGDRERGHLLLLQTAYESRDWLAATLAAENLLSENPGHVDARWAAVNAQMNLGELEGARRTFTSHPEALTPRSAVEASRWLSLFSIYGIELAPVTDAVEVIRRFSDDVDVRSRAAAALLEAPLGALPEGFATEAVLNELQATYPEDPRFQMISGTGLDSAEEILDRLDEAVGHGPDLSEVEHAIARGTVPVGAASVLGGRSFTELLIRLRRAPRFAGPLAGVDEVSFARRALTEQTVVDTTALLTLALLGADHAAHVLPTISAPRTATEQLLDARQAEHAMSRSSEMVFVPSTDTRSRHVVVTDTATLERDSELIAEILALFRQTERGDGAGKLPGPLNALSRVAGPWVSALSLAAETGAPFWCDDAATRRLALGAGVEAFGTPALLQALGENLTLGDERDAVNAMLVHRYTVGVPFTPTVFELAMELDGWQPLGVGVALRHGGPDEAAAKITLMQAALDRAADESRPDSLHEWSRILGEFVGDLDIGDRRFDNLVRVARTLLAQAWQTSFTLPFVAAGLRQAAAGDWSEVLTESIRAMRRDLVSSHGHQVASNYLLGLVRGLPEEDRHRAVGVVLER